MALIIDPPVGPASPASEIRAWIAKLDALAVRHAHDPDELETIAEARAEAAEWLEPLPPA